MIQEDRAGEMWCPFARVAGEGGTHNRIRVGMPSTAGCLGGSCMAWRYIEVRKARGDPDGVEFGRCGLVPVNKED